MSMITELGSLAETALVIALTRLASSRSLVVDILAIVAQFDREIEMSPQVGLRLSWSRPEGRKICSYRAGEQVKLHSCGSAEGEDSYNR